MNSRSMVVSKFYRLQMAEDLRRLLKNLPVENVIEVMKGNHIYLGHGTTRIGARFHPTILRVWEERGDLGLLVSVPNSGIRISCPFRTEEERASAPNLVREAVRKCEN